jgi:hypothetical protein
MDSGGKTPLPPPLRRRQLFIDYIKPQAAGAFFLDIDADSRSSVTAGPRVYSTSP